VANKWANSREAGADGVLLLPQESLDPLEEAADLSPIIQASPEAINTQDPGLESDPLSRPYQALEN
jgi:hypothetical protein